ncbi:MAG: enolase C-terminal domain-like protein [Alphaproteobacteria bacterium]
MARSPLTVRSVVARAVNVPMARPLQTGGGTIASMPLVLIDLMTDQGIVGRSYVFCYTPAAAGPTAQLVQNIGAWLQSDAVAPADIERKLQKRFRLLGAQGLTGIAMAGIDSAAWDALAKAQKLPLVRLLGGTARPIPAYNSCGLGLMGEARAAVEAAELARGFRAVKLRLGYGDWKTDIGVVRAVRRAVGDVDVMVDYNQALDVPEAIKRAHTLDDENLLWIEEPTLAEDYIGHAAIAAAARTPIQIGENWWGSHEMQKSLAARASDFIMPDAVKIGGVTGWLRAIGLAEAAGLPISSHLFPEISAHLLAISPGAHWLEYVDWAAPILISPARVVNGAVLANDTPGAGIEWDEAAVGRFAM